MATALRYRDVMNGSTTLSQTCSWINTQTIRPKVLSKHMKKGRRNGNSSLLVLVLDGTNTRRMTTRRLAHEVGIADWSGCIEHFANVWVVETLMVV